VIFGSSSEDVPGSGLICHVQLATPVDISDFCRTEVMGVEQTDADGKRRSQNNF